MERLALVPIEVSGGGMVVTSVDGTDDLLLVAELGGRGGNVFGFFYIYIYIYIIILGNLNN